MTTQTACKRWIKKQAASGDSTIYAITYTYGHIDRRGIDRGYTVVVSEKNVPLRSEKQTVHTNSELGIEATTYKWTDGKYSIVLLDTDANECVGMKTFRTLSEAIEYAKLCTR